MPQPKRFTDAELREHKNARSRRHYQENKEKRAAYHSALHKARSGDHEYMKKMREKSAAYRVANPGKSKEQNARRRAANPEKARAEVRAWFALNVERRTEYAADRRAKKRAGGGKISRGLKVLLFSEQGEKCPGCLGRFSMRAFHMDHFMPLALGGRHCDQNIQLLCQPCNQRKHAKHPLEFLKATAALRGVAVYADESIGAAA